MNYATSNIFTYAITIALAWHTSFFMKQSILFNKLYLYYFYLRNKPSRNIWEFLLMMGDSVDDCALKEAAFNWVHCKRNSSLQNCTALV